MTVQMMVSAPITYEQQYPTNDSLLKTRERNHPYECAMKRSRQSGGVPGLFVCARRGVVSIVFFLFTVHTVHTRSLERSRLVCMLCPQGSMADRKDADVFEEVQAFNDHGKVLAGVHENFLGVRFNDPTLCKVTVPPKFARYFRHDELVADGCKAACGQLLSWRISATIRFRQVHDIIPKHAHTPTTSRKRVGADQKRFSQI